jgi:tungstate transport system substrate-binding protein
MGPILNTGAAMDGYTLSDRGTCLSFKNKQNLKILVEGDRQLFNQYGVMLVNPAHNPDVKQDLGRRFIDWLTSPEGQRTIADYRINGEPLFSFLMSKPPGRKGQIPAINLAPTSHADQPVETHCR